MNELNTNSRIKELREALKLTRDEFCLKISVGYNQIANIENNRQNTPAWLIEKIAEIYPNYGYWLATGKEIPEAGQISPDTKETQDRLNIKAA